MIGTSLPVTMISFLTLRAGSMIRCLVVMLVMLVLPMPSWSACDDVVFHSTRPIDYGLYRYQQPFKPGWVSLWPDGSFQISRGLSLSHRSYPAPGVFQIRANRGQKILLEVTIQVPAGIEDKVNITNLRVQSRNHVSLNKIGKDYQLEVPVDGNGPMDIVLYVGADLVFLSEDLLTNNILATLQVRCLASSR